MKIPLFAALFGLALGVDTGAEPLRLEATAYPNPPGGNSLNGLKAYLLIEEFQDKASGIDFSLIIVNQGTGSLSLRHEWKNVTMTLWNEHREEVSLRDPLQHGMICRSQDSPYDPQAWVQRVARRSLKYISSDEPRAANERRIGKEGNEPDLIHVDLEPGQELSIRLRVDTIMGDPERYWAEIEEESNEARKRQAAGDPPLRGHSPIPPPTAIPITSGKYTMSVSISLWDNTGLLGSFSLNGVQVRLGAPANDPQPTPSPP